MNILARRTVILATINFGEGKKLETSFHDTAIFPFIAPMRDLKKTYRPASVISNFQTVQYQARERDDHHSA